MKNTQESPIQEILDPLYKEWASRTNEGLIDLHNYDHITILNEMLFDYGLEDKHRYNVISNITKGILNEVDLSKVDFDKVDPERGDDIKKKIFKELSQLIDGMNKEGNDPEAHLLKTDAIGFRAKSHNFRLDITVNLRNKTHNERKPFIDSIDFVLNKYGWTYDPLRKNVSSSGAMIKVVDGIELVVGLKGGKKGNSATDTDQKEGLVVLFFETPEINVDRITEDNYENVVSDLILQIDYCEGLTSKTRAKLSSYLHQIENVTSVKNVLNDALSTANLLRDYYNNGYRVFRTGIYDKVRQAAASIVQIPADKWNPSDIYLIKTSEMSNIQNAIKKAESEANGDFDLQGAIGHINNLFEDEWGAKAAPIVGISLKMAKAQGGKAKSFFKQLVDDDKLYNLTSDERKYDMETLIKVVEEIREDIKDNFKKSDVDIRYKVTGTPDKEERLRQKFGSLKLLHFMSNNVKYRDSDIFTSSAAYAMSLSGVNPTFFKVKGNPKGSASYEKFARDGGITLKNDTINISDLESNGNIQIKFDVESGQKEGSVHLNIRSNGTSQVTIEVLKTNIS